jgi:hypothetical protein
MKVYTLGYALSYDEGLSQPEGIFKGEGGWIWLRALDADIFRNSVLFAEAFPNRDPATFSVYEVDIESWEGCVSLFPDPSDGVHRLLWCSRIVQRIDLT